MSVFHESGPHTPAPTLRQVWRVFLRHRSPRILFVLVSVAFGLRARLGAPSALDLAIAAGLVALHPLTEWLIHVFLLHARPFRIAGRTFDLTVARYHRAHHKDPTDPRWIFIPVPHGLIAGLIVQAGLAALMPTWPLRLTFLSTTLALSLWYEWIHYLVHTRYRPRSAWLRRVWRYHRLHHYKSEHYWFGVSMHLADRVLGTLPDPKRVATSPTCRDLGSKAHDGADPT